MVLYVLLRLGAGGEDRKGPTKGWQAQIGNALAKPVLSFDLYRDKGYSAVEYPKALGEYLRWREDHEFLRAFLAHLSRWGDGNDRGFVALLGIVRSQHLHTPPSPIKNKIAP